MPVTAVKGADAEYTDGKDHAGEGGYFRDEQKVRHGCGTDHIEADGTDPKPSVRQVGL